MRFRKASRARVPDSPLPGECTDSTNSPARRSSLDIPGYKASNLKTRCLKTLRVDPLQLSKIGKII
jgi:hypothetical protein